MAFSLDALLQLGQSVAASSHGVLTGLGELGLKIMKLILESFLVSLQRGHMVLLGSQLVSETSSINHRLLGLLFIVLGLVQHVVNLSIHGVDCALDGSLVSGSLGVDGGHLNDGVSGLAQLVLNLLLAAVCRVQEGLGLVNLSSESHAPSLNQVGLLSKFLSSSGLFLVLEGGLGQLLLVSLDRLLSLIVCLVGMVKSNLQIIDLRLQVLLGSQSFTLGVLFKLKAGLHRLHCSGMVFARIGKLIFLLLDLSINLLFGLCKLQLSSQHLVFLLL